MYNRPPTNLAFEGEPRMSSIDIAEIAGKPHNDLLKAIRAMEPAWQKVAQGNFSLGSYQDRNGQMRPCYLLTKTESLYVATKFNDEARARLVLRWEQLEQAFRMQQATGLPMAFMQQMQQVMSMQQQFIREMSQRYGFALQEVAEMKPKAQYCERVLASHDCMTTSIVAKDLGMSAVRLNRRLHELGIQFKQGHTWLLYAPFDGHGLTDFRTITFGKNDEHTHESLVWTQRGRQFIIKVIEENMNPHEALCLTME